ncbi:MAG: arginine--tRNA ligase [Pirellulales bacterium]|nr:arginine--tRNA ligase [Pirellulales bacterium]
MNILAELRNRFAAALAKIDPSAVELANMVLPSQDARFGDYQANCAMPLGKRLSKPPSDVAEQLVANLDVADLCESPEIAGPGFINLRVQDCWLVEQLHEILSDTEQLGIAASPEPKTYVVDYSSPNVAKPMHVGHIRSTVLGDALCNVLRQLGHRVISDNHLGDWGTQFGMILYGYKHFADEQGLQDDAVAELSRLYKLVNQLIEYHSTREQVIPEIEKQVLQHVRHLEEMHETTILEDPKEAKKAAKRLRQSENQLADLRRMLDELRNKLAEVEGDPQLAEMAASHPDIGNAVLAETAALHADDPTNLALWKRFLPACLEEIDATYQRLHVKFDHTLGESFYHDRLANVVERLTEQGLVQESDGAKCVFLEGFDAPFLVQKKDGAFLYSTTDLATIDYRRHQWSPDAILYVVDHRQSLHFEQLFATVRLTGYTDVELEHVGFGTVLGEDGRPYKTRSGDAVGLSGLLDEAVERAHRIVCENDEARDQPLLSEADRRQVAERIGIGAIKYADLAHNRTSDYVFSYDKMLAMNGNTAAYMQYSYARVRSIFAKGGVDIEALRTSGAEILLREPAERALALALLRFSEALEKVVADYRPNHLTAYLFELASIYSGFFENCPVLKAKSEAVRNSRLLLCDLTARTIARGLNLLGIETVERM